jgi:hypothetical protein
MAPKCSAWCMWSTAKGEQQCLADRQRDLPMVRFCAQVALHQLKHGRHFLIENPKDSAIWRVHCFQQLLKQESVTWGNLNFCAWGMQDPVSKDYFSKATSLVHNFPEGILDPIFRPCPRTTSTKL